MNMHSSAIFQPHRGRRGKMAYDIWPGMKCKNAPGLVRLSQTSKKTGPLYTATIHYDVI